MRKNSTLNSARRARGHICKTDTIVTTIGGIVYQILYHHAQVIGHVDMVGGGIQVPFFAVRDLIE